MNVTQFALPLWTEVGAVMIGASQGAMYASKFHDRRIDLLGVVLIGLCTGVGGSLVRDALLGDRSTALGSNWFLTAAVVAAVGGVIAERALTRLDPLILLLDALTVGAFAAIGTTKALAAGVPLAPSLFVGTAGAVGGSALRDLLLGLPVALVQVGSLYAVAAILGGGVLIGSLACGARVTVAAILCTLTTTVIRLAALFFGWTLPSPQPWSGRPR